MRLGQPHRRATLSEMHLVVGRRAEEGECSWRRDGESAGCATQAVSDRRIERTYDPGDGHFHSWEERIYRCRLEWVLDWRGCDDVYGYTYCVMAWWGGG